ncbi:MAG: DoxX family rane protein [Gammaproteobacteria bacterium]|nr:DoxX family rane protein [Gammaproteobacteria bacterium]
MAVIIKCLGCAQNILDKIRGSIDFIGPLLLRIYLVPVFWVASNNKWNPFNMDSSLMDTIDWFGDTEWGLGLPFPVLNAYMAWSAEYFGAILLALGLATRWICIPLMATMIVAAVTVHIDHGWQAIHDIKSPFASEYVAEAIDRLDEAKSILKEHGDYDQLTEYGSFVALNNGIEWPATYFILLLALFFIGGGRYISVDYWIARKFRH